MRKETEYLFVCRDGTCRWRGVRRSNLKKCPRCKCPVDRRDPQAASKGEGERMTTLADLVTVARHKDTITLWLATECLPAVRQTRAGKWTEPRAVAYNSWQETWKERIRMAIASMGVEPLPGGVPLFFYATFQYARIPHNSDLDNLCKSALDLCQGVVFTGSDSWVDQIITGKVETSLHGVNINCGLLTGVR